jgi:hypothetical protein
MFAGQELPDIAHFDLFGSRLAVAMLLDGRGGEKNERGLSLTFSPAQEVATCIGIGDAQSAANLSLHRDRILKVRCRMIGTLEKPRTFRRWYREALRQAEELKELEPCPTAAQYRVLLVNRQMSLDEFTLQLTLQLVIVLSRWGLLEINQEDRDVFLTYLCRLRRKPKAFLPAAEEALSLLFTNWALPSDVRSFESYAKKIVWAQYAKGARNDSGGRSSSVPTKRSAIDLAEIEVEQAKRGKRPQRMSVTHLSVPELARASWTDSRRIYERIKTGNLRAIKIGSSLSIDYETAVRFIFQAREKRKIADLRRKLSDLGQSKEATRKWISRRRIAGASETRIIDLLQLKVTQLCREASDRERDL